MATRNQDPEKEMYPLVADLLEEESMRVISEPKGFSVGLGKHRVDVLGFRWQDKDILSVAVEAKPGAATAAIEAAFEQARTYQRYFDRVYIAGQGSIQSDTDARKRLSDLTIGYIAVERFDAARIELEPSSSRKKEPTLYREEVRSRLAMLLAFEEAMGQEISRDGKYNDGRAYAAIDLIDGVQINCDFDPQPHERVVKFGVNIQQKDIMRRLFQDMPVKALMNGLKALPSDYVLRVYRREGLRAGKVTAVPVEFEVQNITKNRADEVLRTIRSMLGKDSYLRPHFHLFRALWTVEEEPSRSRCVSMMTTAKNELFGFVREICLR